MDRVYNLIHMLVLIKHFNLDSLSAFCSPDKWKVARYCFLIFHAHSALPIKENGARGEGRDKKLYMLSSIMVVSTTLSLSRFVYDRLLDKEIIMA